MSRDIESPEFPQDDQEAQFSNECEIAPEQTEELFETAEMTGEAVTYLALAQGLAAINVLANYDDGATLQLLQLLQEHVNGETEMNAFCSRLTEIALAFKGAYEADMGITYKN